MHAEVRIPSGLSIDLRHLAHVLIHAWAACPQSAQCPQGPAAGHCQHWHPGSSISIEPANRSSSSMATSPAIMLETLE